MTVAAQRVQRSAYPDAYADDEPLARRLLADLDRATQRAGVIISAASTSCSRRRRHRQSPCPSRELRVCDQENLGNSGSAWSSSHTGTDLSVACGTPVLAATAGTIVFDRPALGRTLAGPGLHRPRPVEHLVRPPAAALTVADGHVASGQQIGEVGDLGNSTGCHLHFEVHPRGTIYGPDNTNPTTWLRRPRRPPPARPVPEQSRRPAVAGAVQRQEPPGRRRPSTPSPAHAARTERDPPPRPQLAHTRSRPRGLHPGQRRDRVAGPGDRTRS